MDNNFKVARRASGLSSAEAASICNVSSVTYSMCRENSPEKFKLLELRKLYTSMDEISQQILLKAVVNFLRQ